MLLSRYLGNPSVTRSEVREVMAAHRRPATAVRIKCMKEAYNAFLADQQIAPLLASLRAFLDAPTPPARAIPPLRRENLVHNQAAYSEMPQPE